MHENDKPVFYSDVILKDMLFAKLVRSPAPQGIIRAISGGLGAGRSLYTAGDIPGRNRVTAFGAEREVFPSKRVSFMGEPLGIVTAEDPDAAAEGAASVTLDIGKDGASHRGAPQQFLTRTVTNNGPEPPGDLLEVRGSYSVNLRRGIISEPGGCAARFSGGKLTVYCAIQWEDVLRENLAANLNLPPEGIDIVPTKITGPSSMELWYTLVLACQTALASMLSGRPVKLVLSREEHEALLGRPVTCVITHRSAVTPEGLIASLETEILADCGNRAPFGEEILRQLLAGAPGMYGPKRFRAEGVILTSNTAPAGVCLAQGGYHSFFAIESHLQDIAALTGLSPLDIHRLNSSAGTAALDSVARMSDFARKYWAYDMNSRARVEGRNQSFSEPIRGIGIAWAAPESSPSQAGGGAPPSVAAVVEVEIDPFTLREKIRGVWAAVECAEEAGAKQAEPDIRRAVFEALSSFVKDDSYPVPDIHLAFPQEASAGPVTGDGVLAALPAAFTNALSQAVSYSIHNLPIETDTAFRFITERKSLEGQHQPEEAEP
ncbi:MAG: molybdopterin-dependent oxidoreductase [Spirochaetaceae bacterium]|jgi:CO/xanthine dehydrogenase Mo-binding subunit|nr:molybdopterin-dependent oxidoreductase [Spirochaetaceae bacterium]